MWFPLTYILNYKLENVLPSKLKVSFLVGEMVSYLSKHFKSSAMLSQIIFILAVFEQWHYFSLCRTYQYVGSKSCFVVGKIPFGEFLLVFLLSS